MVHAKISSILCLSAAGSHNMVYKQWGDSSNPRVLICVHGLTRVSDDFIPLAQELSKSYRIICPDIAGRGLSDWLSQYKDYQLDLYVRDMHMLIDHIFATSAVEELAWLGTSMGGLIGIYLAGKEGVPINKLILNDIGPSMNIPALLRIGQYIGQQVRFNTFSEAVSYMRQISVGFGSHTDVEWDTLASHVFIRDPEGFWMRHYDPGVARAFQEETPASLAVTEKKLWQAYDKITCPTLLIHGLESDLLTSEVALEMTKRGPKASLVELPGVGHTPTFVHSDQINIVKDFLLA